MRSKPNRPERRWRRIVTLLVVVATFAAGAALALSPKLRAALRITPGFHPSAADARVRVEEGAEAFGALLAEALPGAIAAVESAHGRPFPRPFRVYACASRASFAHWLGAAPDTRVRGMALARDVWLSPFSLEFEGQDTHRESLAHELSHLHVYQCLGKRRQLGDVPNWFSEGLADWASGTGYEVVTPAEARAAILHGTSLVPDIEGRLPVPKAAPDYGLTYPMLHAQSRLFLEYLAARDEAGFRAFVGDVLEGEPFGPAFERRIGRNVTAAWEELRASL